MGMKEAMRRAIAYSVALRAGRIGSSIYSYADGRYVSMSGSAANFFDHDENAYISGSGTNLYHYGQNCHFDLKVEGGKFSGYDYGSACHFEGTIKGGSISIYDYGESRYFEYQA